MNNKNYNDDFFGWDGVISRKNFAINFIIVFFAYVLLYFINFQAFEPYIQFKFLLTILIYIVEILKIVLVMSALSLVYRRISDFSQAKSYRFKLVLRRFFIFIYVLPAIYLLFIRMFLFPMPIIVNFIDLVTIFFLIPLSLICSFILFFIKGK